MGPSTPSEQGNAPPPKSSLPNVRTAGFREQLAKLPPAIQQAANEAYEAFLRDPFDPSLERHDLYDSKKGRHRAGSVAVSITRRYRAIFVPDGNTNVWYWIGSHQDYNNLVGRK